MTDPSDLDTIINADNAHAVHPWRELVSQRFYVDRVVNTEGGLWLALINGLLLVPLVMASFFYPVQALLVAIAIALSIAAGFLAYAAWQRRQGRTRT